MRQARGGVRTGAVSLRVGDSRGIIPEHSGGVPPPPEGLVLNKIMRTLIWAAALGVIILFVIRQPFGPMGTHTTKLKTSEFVRRIQQGTIRTVVLERTKATGTMDPQD